MGSKSDLPHLSMPVMDTLEDLESSFNAQLRHKLAAASGDTSLTQDNESEQFMSQVSLKLDSLCKDEEFDLANTSPLQELGSLSFCDDTKQTDTALATDAPIGSLFGDDENSIEGVTDDLAEQTAQLSCGRQEDKDVSFDQSDVSEASCSVSELVVHAPQFDSLLESTTPMGTIYSNDTTTSPVEHDPKKGKLYMQYITHMHGHTHTHAHARTHMHARTCTRTLAQPLAQTFIFNGLTETIAGSWI